MVRYRISLDLSGLKGWPTLRGVNCNCSQKTNGVHGDFKGVFTHGPPVRVFCIFPTINGGLGGVPGYCLWVGT